MHRAGWRRAGAEARGSLEPIDALALQGRRGQPGGLRSRPSAARRRKGRSADADLDHESGLDLLLDTIRFITPGNVLGLPSVALPMGEVDGLPTGIQIYADLWREDLCLNAAGVIEAAVGQPTPIDPR